MPIPAIQLYRPFSVAGALAAVLLTAFGRAPAQTQADPLERTVVVSVVNENRMNLRGLESNHFRGGFGVSPWISSPPKNRLPIVCCCFTTSAEA